MERITVAGHTLRLYRSSPGTGPLALYLHSATGEMGALPLFDALESRGIGVVAPELPGFGTFDFPEDWDRVEDHVFFLRQLLDELSPRPTVVIGASLGGWLAAELAAWFPGAVEDLVLLNPVGLKVDGRAVRDPFGAPGETVDDLMAKANPHGHNLMGDLIWALEDPTDLPALMLHSINAGAAAARLAWSPPGAYDPKLLGRLAGITARTLVLWGDDDGYAPQIIGSAYAERIPGARLMAIEHCGHSPALEQPAVVADRVATFLHAATVG
jgi:pimeloyl-ACP methyl ester carboxylesterase